MRPGSKVLYLGAASGTSVSHVADIVGPTGTVYAVEFSHRSGRDLITMATHRTNVIPIIEDARHPLRYRMLVGMVDVIFADVAQPDQARIVGLNAHLFLKVDGGVLVSVKANCIDSTAKPEVVFAKEVTKLREERIKPKEQLTLGTFSIRSIRPSGLNRLTDSSMQNLLREIIVWWRVSTHDLNESIHLVNLAWHRGVPVQHSTMDITRRSFVLDSATSSELLLSVLHECASPPCASRNSKAVYFPRAKASSLSRRAYAKLPALLVRHPPSFKSPPIKSAHYRS